MPVHQGVSRPSITPVHTRIVVVNCMIAIVEQKHVDEAHEIASVVILRLFIGMDMLKIVENQHAE